MTIELKGPKTNTVRYRLVHQAGAAIDVVVACELRSHDVLLALLQEARRHCLGVVVRVDRQNPDGSWTHGVQWAMPEASQVLEFSEPPASIVPVIWPGR